MDITQKIDAVTKIGQKRILAGGFQPPPKSVKIELTSRCNLRCKYCVTRNRVITGNQDMDLDFFKKITEDMKRSGVEEVGLFYLGESTLVPGLLVNALKWCKQLEFNWVFLTSNATLVTSNLLKELMEGGLDSLKWSINFNSPERFSEVTGRSQELYHNVIKTLRIAHRLKELGGYKTLLSASSILYDNSEKEKFLKFIEEEISPYVDKHYWLPLYQMGMYADKIKSAMGYTPTIGNMGRIDDETGKPIRPGLPCWSIFTEGHVRVDGGLSACCFGADDKFDMGKLDGENFMQQWNSDKFQNLRKAHIKTIEQGQSALSGSVCEICMVSK